MADEALADKAADEILKRIIAIAPEVEAAKVLLDLAEAYALVTGKVTSRGTQVTASK